MELLAPAGNKQKLEVAFHYGADAVYVGGSNFNLRTKSDNFSIDDFIESIALAKKLNKKIYLTLNSYLHQRDIGNFISYLKEISQLKFDGYIVSDLGVMSLLKNIIPDSIIHISTQANVLNSESVAMYESFGASRIILARECSLSEIKSIRESTQLEIEVFAHGAVCMSYSGRCLLSNYISSRDANGGDCVQVCRWNFKTYAKNSCNNESINCGGKNNDDDDNGFFIEEQSRKGTFLPIEEGDNYTTIMSAKDLRMAEYIHLLNDVGVDCIKIEGRMKSIYYVANTIRVYRILIDTLLRLGSGKEYEIALKKEPLRNYIVELDSISRRESDTGFFLSDRDNEENNNKAIEPTLKSYLNGRRLMAMVIANESRYCKIQVFNTIKLSMPLVYIGISFINYNDNMYKLYIKDSDGNFIETESVRNIDDAYILPTSNLCLTKYDIITLPI